MLSSSLPYPSQQVLVTFTLLQPRVEPHLSCLSSPSSALWFSLQATLVIRTQFNSCPCDVIPPLCVARVVECNSAFLRAHITEVTAEREACSTSGMRNRRATAAQHRLLAGTQPAHPWKSFGNIW